MNLTKCVSFFSLFLFLFYSLHMILDSVWTRGVDRYLWHFTCIARGAVYIFYVRSVALMVLVCGGVFVFRYCIDIRDGDDQYFG